MPAGDPLRKVSAGDPFKISAATFNSFVEAAKANQQRNLNQVGPGGNGGNPNMLFVRNDTGADVGLYNVLGIGNLVISPSGSTGQLQQNIAISCKTPSGGSRGNFVVTAQPIGNGKFGHAWADGVFPVQVNVASGAGNFADVSSGSVTTLATSASGSALIMTKQGGVGVQWTLCRMASAPGAGGGDVPTPTATGQMLTTTDGATWSLITPSGNGQVVQVVSSVPAIQLHELT